MKDCSGYYDFYGNYAGATAGAHIYSRKIMPLTIEDWAIFYTFAVVLFLLLITYKYLTTIDNFYSIKMLKWFIFVCISLFISFYIFYEIIFPDSPRPLESKLVIRYFWAFFILYPLIDQLSYKKKIKFSLFNKNTIARKN